LDELSIINLDMKKIPYVIFAIIVSIRLTNLKLIFPFFNQQLYYAFLFIILAYLMINFKVKKINPFSVLLIITTACSLIFNTIPEYFDSTFRWFGWVLILITLGPLISNSGFSNFRKRSLNWVFLICQTVGVLSFFWFILGLPNLGRGDFSGLTYHSMILGPIASIGFLSILNKIIFQKINILFFIPLFLCFVSTLLAASRTAIIALLFASIIVLFYRFKKKSISIIIIFGFLTLSVSGSFLNSLNNKGDKNSRIFHWTDRIEEFNSSPVYGIGFASIFKGSSGDGGDGMIEPGSSWMAILSMTGILGFLNFILLIYSILMKLKKKSSNFNFKESSLYMSIITFFLVSFISEGYVFASGSILTMIFWLVLGRVYDYNTNNEIR